MPRIITPGLAYKHLRRYRQVVAVLTKYGFGEFIGQIRIWEYINIEKKLLHRGGEFEHLTTPQRLRLAMEELGPTFVKLGQMLSTRPDILPLAFITELEKLQNQVAPIPTETAKGVIESELKKPIDKIFTSFQEQPLAAASLAQVHRAVINGQEVVVKVQRPHIIEVIEVDLDIMRSLASLMDRYLRGSYVINPVGLVNEFSENIKRELDFRIEANNMQHFARNFAGTPWLKVPLVYSESGLTQRVLIMEYIEGINVSEVDRLKREGYDLKLLANRGAVVGLRSALEFGFFHADPHPGNIFILPDNHLCLLDYGMMGTLSARYRERLGKLLYYMSINDEKRTARTLLGLIESTEVLDAEIFEADVANVIQEYSHATMRDVQLGLLLFRLLRILQRYRARFPTRLIWLFKSIATVEDVSRKIDPDFEILESVTPFARRLLMRDLNPLRKTREAYLTALDSFDLLRDLPYDAGVVLDQLKKGRVKIEFEHIGLEPIRKTLEKVSNHIALTLLLAALLIASSLIILSGIPPQIASIPIIGLAGFGISAILFIWLVISISLR
jgi:ubiquinone biosynthesis protein